MSGQVQVIRLDPSQYQVIGGRGPGNADSQYGPVAPEWTAASPGASRGAADLRPIREDGIASRAWAVVPGGSNAQKAGALATAVTGFLTLAACTSGTTSFTPAANTSSTSATASASAKASPTVSPSADPVPSGQVPISTPAPRITPGNTWYQVCLNLLKEHDHPPSNMVDSNGNCLPNASPDGGAPYDSAPGIPDP
jgi:hypothetical protein